MSNSGKIWDVKEVYKLQRNNTWSRASTGAWFGGFAPTATNVIQSVNMDSTGNASDFGDLSSAKERNVANASSTRAVVALGGTSNNTIDYKEFKSTGNTADFGDLSQVRDYMMSHGGTATRGTFSGGSQPSSPYVSRDTIDVISPQTTGNAVDFGDCTAARNAGSGGGNETRGVCFGGYFYPSNTITNIIDFVTFASSGGASDFGDLGSAQLYTNGVGGKVRAFNLGGNLYPGNTTRIDVVTIATTGNGSDFGDLTFAAHNNYSGGLCENKIRAMVAGGNPGSGAANNISFITQTTNGNTSDFGDLATGIREGNNAGTSNNHSGITEDTQVQLKSVTYMPGSGRALFTGGQNPSVSTSIDMTMIKTKGNSSSFGTLATGMRSMSSASSLTRSLSAGGYSSDYTNAIRSVEFASQGNDSDFGDLIGERYDPQSGNVGNTTRGIFAGGHEKSGNAQDNVIQYITIATAGNATDFGDLSAGRQSMAGMTSNTRGVFAGGTSGPANVNIMEYITIASTSNVTDFGDLSAVRTEAGGLSSSTRGIIGGGDLGTPSILNIIEYITIASTSGTTDFGDLSASRQNMATGSDSITGVFAGGQAPSDSNVIDFITIASTGDAADFGDITSARRGLVGTSDSHGGLQA